MIAPEKSESEWLSGIHARMRQAAAVFRLPARAGMRQGGQLMSQASGSSTDFRDHRMYAPGDDPRHINWQAYGRTGSYILKVFHQEASPLLDVLIDLSPSMRLNEAKKERAAELLYFCLENAGRLGTAIRLWGMNGAATSLLETAALMDHQWPILENGTGVPAFEAIPWRPASMRVVVSDLLFPDTAAAGFSALSRDRGRAFVFAPFCLEEADPDWLGQAEFEDCETGRKRGQRVDHSLLARYKQAYERHFEIWQQHAARYGICLTRVNADSEFISAMQLEPLRRGAVELTR